MPKLGWVRMRDSLRYAGHLVSATVSRHAGHWYASITVDTPDDPPLPQAENQGAVGVDLGITALATLSNGEKVVGPKALKTLLNKMRRLARSLWKKVKGSHNRDKAKMKLAKLHAKIADIRRDCLHKLTTDITRRFHTIVIEDLVRIAGIALRLQAQVAAQARRKRLETPATPDHVQDCAPWWHADRGRSLVCEQQAVFKLRVQAGLARSGIEAMGLPCLRRAP